MLRIDDFWDPDNSAKIQGCLFWENSKLDSRIQKKGDFALFVSYLNTKTDRGFVKSILR